MMTVRDRIQRLITEGKYTKAEIARQINYGRSTLAQYLGGQYKGGAESIERALVGLLARVGEGTTDDALYPTRFIETTATTRTKEALRRAQENKELHVIVGPPGCGKSFGIKDWADSARVDGVEFVQITANIATNGYVAVICMIAEALKISSRSRSYDTLQRIIDRLRRDPALLIIDEAQFLKVPALEAVRTIYDEAKVGVALSGSLQLYRTLHFGDVRRVRGESSVAAIVPTDGEGFAREALRDSFLELRQLFSRIANIETLPVLNAIEVAKFVTIWLGSQQPAEVVARFRAQSKGFPRQLVRLLTIARALRAESPGAHLTADLVDEAARKLEIREEAA